MKLRIWLLAVVVTASSCKTVEQVEPSADLKFARIMRLEDERSLGAGELLTRLSDPIPLLRRRAAVALGRIGDPETAGSLAVLLTDASDPVRASAAFSLGLLEGPLPEEIRAALRLAISDPSLEVRARAIEALGRKSSEETAETIALALRDWLPTGPTPYTWGEEIERSATRLPHIDLRLGLFALARIGNLRWAWNLLGTEERNPRFLWWPAVWTTSRFDEVEIAPLLLHYAGSNDPYYRVLGTRGLANLPPQHSQRAVVRLLEDPDERVRIEAVRAAAKLGLSETVPRMLELLAGDTLFVQIEAARALAQLPSPNTVEPLIDRLIDPEPLIRSAVLRALAFQDSETFWFLLSGLDPDPDWRARSARAQLFSEMSDERALALLLEMTSDRDYRVRAQVLQALIRTSSEDSIPVFLEHLSAEDPFERVAAAKGLEHFKPEGAVEPLRAAYDFSARDQEPDARLAIMAALEAYGAEAVEPTARLALEDRSWNVRKRAENILRRLGDLTARAAPIDSDRTLMEFRTLIHPKYTPQAFIRTEKGAIEVELFILDAPLTVDNFMRLARRGFYNGLAFDLVPNEFVQTGDPRGDSHGGPGYTIRSEINTRPFLRGTLGMSVEGKDTGGSRFFITYLPQPQLEGVSTVFGQVINGMSVLDRIEPGDAIREIVIWDGISDPNSPPTLHP